MTSFGTTIPSPPVQWFMTWIECVRTGLLYLRLALCMALYQFAHYIVVPCRLLSFVVWHVLKGILTTPKRTSPRDKERRGTSIAVALMDSCVVNSLAIARHSAVDERWLRALRSAVRREAAAERNKRSNVGTRAPVFMMVANGGGVGHTPKAGGNQKSLRSFEGAEQLTVSEAVAFIETASLVLGVDLFALGIDSGEPIANAAGAVTHSVAVMMLNSPFYIPLTISIAQCSNVINVLDYFTVCKRAEQQDNQQQSMHTGSEELGAALASSLRRRASTGSDLYQQRYSTPTTSNAFLNCQAQMNAPRSVAHSCSASLLNTNIANNEMLSRSIASCGSNVLVIEAPYVPLLFTLDAAKNPRSASFSSASSTMSFTSLTDGFCDVLRVSIPSSIRKIYLWHSEELVVLDHEAYQCLRTAPPSLSAVPAGCAIPQVLLSNGIRLEHLRAIAEYNDSMCTASRRHHELYIDDVEELNALWLSNATIHGFFPKRVRRFAEHMLPSLVEPTSEAAEQLRNGGSPLSTPTFSHRVSPHDNGAHSTPQSTPPLRMSLPPSSDLRRTASGLLTTTNNISTLSSTSSSSQHSNSEKIQSQRSAARESPLHAKGLYDDSNELRQAAGWYVDLIVVQLGMKYNVKRLKSFQITPPYRQPSASCSEGRTVMLSLASDWLCWWRRVRNAFRPNDTLLKIFTSGTTGLPKAAKFSHLRYIAALNVSAQLDVASRTRSMLKRRTSDKSTLEEWGRVVTVYNALPMYHSAGGVFCGCHLLNALEAQPARMVIRKKFSSSQFSKDLVTYRVNVLQYIGECLRYALQYDKSQLVGGQTDTGGWKVPVAFGNGLRPDIWDDVLRVLPIDGIAEFYGSTEGNVALFNLRGERCVVGHVPIFPFPFFRLSPIFWPFFPLVFAVYDPVTEAPKQFPGEGGYSRVTAIGEDGELLGKVREGFDIFGVRRFEGYNDSSETRKKLLRNVFCEGDVYFRSGDILRFDARGFALFVDRIGDTFRWKGENVSTQEVAIAMNRVVSDGLQLRVDDAVVFGVAVPGRDGKAGMAKLALSEYHAADESLEKIGGEKSGRSAASELVFFTDILFRALTDKASPASLPMYAVPCFIRMEDPVQRDDFAEQSPVVQSEMTATFKYRKGGLSAEGYLPAIPLHGARFLRHSTANNCATTAANRSSSQRYYVLVNPTVMAQYKEMTFTPTTKSGRNFLRAEMLSTCGERSTAEWGYIPLNDAVMTNLLGSAFENCGW